MKKQYGLIGFPLKHSFSPGYFAAKFKEEGIVDAEYKLYELSNIDEFNDLMKLDLKGLNVTIPYKEKVIPFLNRLSDEAAKIGAVNTIVFSKDELIGHNTDCYGFSKSLQDFYQDKKPDSALILGSGGASKAVKYSLDKLKIDSQVVSRKANFLNYQDLREEHFEGRVLIVNTTPLGTWPDVDSAADIPYSFLSDRHFLYDLVYNPEKTLFLREGEHRGASIKNGHDMLKIQAEKSWEIWNS